VIEVMKAMLPVRKGEGAGMECDRLSPELKMLIACLAQVTAGSDRAFATLASQPLDWARFAALARRHRVRPMAIAAFAAAGRPLMPTDVRLGIERRAAGVSRRSMLQAEELRRVAEALDESGVRAIWLKGPALGVQAFGSPAIRESVDLDLLFDLNDLPALDAVLRGLGYRSVQRDAGLTRRQRRAA
jgi:hypothetical protein